MSSCTRHSKGRQGIKGKLVVWNHKVRVTPENKESVNVRTLSSLRFKSNRTTGTEEGRHQHPGKQYIVRGRNCKSLVLTTPFLPRSRLSPALAGTRPRHQGMRHPTRRHLCSKHVLPRAWAQPKECFHSTTSHHKHQDPAPLTLRFPSPAASTRLCIKVYRVRTNNISLHTVGGFVLQMFTGSTQWDNNVGSHWG